MWFEKEQFVKLVRALFRYTAPASSAKLESKEEERNEELETSSRTAPPVELVADAELFQ